MLANKEPSRRSKEVCLLMGDFLIMMVPGLSRDPFESCHTVAPNGLKVLAL